MDVELVAAAFLMLIHDGAFIQNQRNFSGLPWTVAISLLPVSITAYWIPATLAAGVNPSSALRSE